MKKIIVSACAMLAAAMTLSAAAKKGTVRYLNFKPEVTAVYEELAKAYEQETGVKVIVETAANEEWGSDLYCLVGVPAPMSLKAVQ